MSGEIPRGDDYVSDEDFADVLRRGGVPEDLIPQFVESTSQEARSHWGAEPQDIVSDLTDEEIDAGL